MINLMKTDTKSKNLEIYPYFLNHNDPKSIPYKEIAEQRQVHPNRIRGMVRAAKHNPTIYAALRMRGYTDSQIPQWFGRPPPQIMDKIQALSQSPERSTPQTRSTTAQNRSSAEPLSAKRTPQAPLAYDNPGQTQRRSVPLSSAQRPSVESDDYFKILSLSDGTTTLIPKHQFSNSTISGRNTPFFEESFFSNTLTRQYLQNLEEERRKNKEEELNWKINREINSTYDPFTAINIYKKNPKWRAWYNGLSPREKNKTIESITQMLNFRANARNQQQWNTFYNTWMWGRYMGNW